MVVALWVLLADRDDVSYLDRILDLQGCWDLGEHEPGVLGLANRELRVLGWYRSRRYADFRDLVLVPPELANEYQPSGGSHDDLRRYLRWDLSWYSRRSRLVGFLAIAIPEFESLDVAAVP